MLKIDVRDCKTLGIGLSEKQKTFVSEVVRSAQGTGMSVSEAIAALEAAKTAILDESSL